MADWSVPKIQSLRCSLGEEVTVVDADNIQRGGGKVVCRIPYRTIICQKTGPGGERFQLEERQPWMCDDCSLVR